MISKTLRVIYSSEASSFGDLRVKQVDGRVFFDVVLFKGTVVLKYLEIKDECRLTGMHAFLLEHFLNVFNGVLELDLKFDGLSTFNLCLYEDLVTNRTGEVDVFMRFRFDYKAESNYTVIGVLVTIDSDEFFIVCKQLFAPHSPGRMSTLILRTDARRIVAINFIVAFIEL